MYLYHNKNNKILLRGNGIDVFYSYSTPIFSIANYGNNGIEFYINYQGWKYSKTTTTHTRQVLTEFYSHLLTDEQINKIIQLKYNNNNKFCTIEDDTRNKDIKINFVNGEFFNNNLKFKI